MSEPAGSSKLLSQVSAAAALVSTGVTGTAGGADHCCNRRLLRAASLVRRAAAPRVLWREREAHGRDHDQRRWTDRPPS